MVEWVSHFVVHISFIYLEATEIVHEKNDLPSPKFHIQIVVGFVVQVHFDAPIKMNKIFGQPSLGKKNGKKLFNKTPNFFVNTFYSQCKCQFVVFKLFKKTNPYFVVSPLHLVTHSARNRSKEHRSRARELHWVKGQKMTQKPHNSWCFRRQVDV